MPSPPFNAPWLYWVMDSLAAALFALALALALDGLAAGDMARGAIAAAVMAAAGLLRAGLQACAETGGVAAAGRARQSARAMLFPGLLRTRAPGRRLLGEDVSIAVDQVANLSGYHARFRPLRRAAAIAPPAVAALTALASPVSAVILLATLLPFGLGMALAGGAARREADAQADALTRLSGLFMDRVRALPIILAFAAEERAARQVDSAARDLAARSHAVLRIAFLSSGTLEFFSAISVALVAVYCGFNLLGLLPFPVPERLDLPRAVFVLALAPEFYLPLRRLSAAYHDRQIGEAAATAITERAREPHAPPPAAAPPESITITDAMIDHGDGRMVGPFSLSLARGEFVALTGPTGSGKTSLLHMLIGLAPLAAGRLSFVPGSANRHIGWAGQHVVLLPGTIADNIALADPEAPRTAIAAAAHRAGLDGLLAMRSAGLDTWIDPHGAGLSGGERRRIALARALLADRPVLLLDEPTAHLDADTAMAIIALLRAMAGRHGILAATHDPALIAAADRVVALA